MRTRIEKGFTLVEILIVVVILGILAAIVIPQFTNASTEAKESSLVSNLQSIRSQIELYKIHHGGNPPAQGSLITAMTLKTNSAGVNPVPAGDIAYGPYMKSVPLNPFSSDTTVEVVNAFAASTTNDWFYTVTGTEYEFGANDGQANAVTGVQHEDL